MGVARSTMLAVLAGVVWLGAPGCVVVSLFPLYEAASVEALPSLVGCWRNDEDRVSLDIAVAEWGSYGVTWRETSGTYRGHAYLTRVGGALFADVTAPPGEERGPLLVVVHGWCRVRLAGDTLCIEALDYDRWSDPIHRQTLPGAHVDERGNVLITAPTATLRSWLARNAHRAGVFAAPIAFARAPPSC